MAMFRFLGIAILLIGAAMPAAAGGPQAQSAADPSLVEWTAERYLGARPMEPLRVRSVKRDLPETASKSSLGTSFAGVSAGASGRAPSSRRLPDFDFYIHARGALPRHLTPVSRLSTGRAAVLAPVGPAPLENRGTAGLEFSSSRLVPTDARVVYPYSAVGKLFFDEPGGGSGYCSASVIQRRLVLTAGHCVNTPGKGWHKNFSFVPAYHKGNAPFGTWRAETIWATGEWLDGGARYPNSADFGVLVMRDNAEGERLGQVTGWLGWQTQRLTPNHVHILGYPSNLDRGAQMHQVTSSSFDCCFTNTAIYGTDMRQGSSGGPWVQNFGVRATKQGIGKNKKPNRVVGVYSWLYTDDKKVLIAGSSIPRSSFADLIREACNDGPGNCS